MANLKRIQFESQRCRVCLDNEGIIPIFGDGSNPDISVNFMTFGTIEVLKHDDFPKSICHVCFTLLDGAVTFRKTAIQSDALLKERKKLNNFPAMTVKAEIELLPNVNETISKEHNYQTVNKKENSNIEVKLELDENPNVDGDDDISLMTVGKEKATTVKNEDLKMNAHDVSFQTSGLQLTNQASNALKANYIVISEGKIKTEISHQPTPEVIAAVKCNICKKLLSKKNYSSHMRIIHNIKRQPKQCQKCNKLLRPEYFSRHMKEVHAEDKKPRYNKSYRCEICCIDFTETTYARHVRREHKMTPKIPPKKKECPICKKMFRLDYLVRHIKFIHKGEKKPKPHFKTNNQAMKKECLVCKKMYEPAYLGIHMKNIHGERKPKVRVECTVCKGLFAQNYIKLHEKTHEAAKKNYVCDVCGKEFFFQSSFANHKLIHINELPFKCDHCPYKGRSKQNLRIHSRTHAKEYPYKCDQCDKRCITKSNLNRHMRNHINAVDFVCDTCNKGFYSKLELERHISCVHLGIRNHICNICGSAFGYKSRLGEHQRIVHKIRKRGPKSNIILQQQPI